MKLILVSALMALVFTHTFSKWMVVVEYNLNKDFIAKNLCVNKAKPKLHCKGKCQMMKKLAEEEKQNSTENNSTKIKMQELVFSNEIHKPVVPIPVRAKRSYNEDSPVSEYNSPLTSIFHPPSMG
jgi:hypothetical protein